MTCHVVTTGMDGVTTFGGNQQAVSARLLAYEDVVRKMPEWQVHDGLHTLLEAPIDDFTLPGHYTHKRIRAMGRVSLVSTRTTELALEQTGLIDDRILTNGGTGIVYGLSVDSTGPIGEFVTILTEKHTNNITGTTYVQVMPHITVVNTGLLFGLHGRIIPTSNACTPGSQVIDYVWEVIRHGYQTVMVADGAEELCPSETAVLGTLFAISQCNDEPKTTLLPFDEERDGLVIGEGVGTLMLEELEHAKACEVTIYSETVGFATSCDAAHITQPQRGTVQIYVEKSLNMASISARDTSYISAHGTATDHGDVAESQAIPAIYGDNVPPSSLKSHSGHALGACGALEAWMSLQVIHEDWSTPTLSLSQPDVNCGALDYIIGEARKIDCESLQSNNFAFGSINTPIIIKRWP